MYTNFGNSHLEKDRLFLNEISQTDISLLKGLKLLVVDNDTSFLLLLTFLFEDYLTEVKTAISVDEANKTMQQWQPDILITDIGMEEKDGYCLIRSIRDKEALQGGFLPIIVLSAYSEKDDAVLNRGYQKFILKPFQLDELVAEVVKLVQRQRFLAFYIKNSYIK